MLFPNILKERFRIFKKNLSTCERTLSGEHICVQNFKSISWKMFNLWHFECRRWPIFTLFPGISTFLRFSKFVWYRPLKKYFGVIFFRFLRKLTKKTCITRPKHNIFNLTVPWPRDLEWPWPWIHSPKA